jgi:hypothetical protein
VSGWSCALCEATLAGTAVKRAKSDRAICTWCEADLAARERRRCRQCNRVKALAVFTAASRPWQCKDCAAAYRKAYRATHREQLREREIARYQADPAASYARSHKTYQKHRERIKAQRRERYLRNRDRALAQKRAYYEKNREQIRAYQRSAWSHNAERQRLYRLRRKLAILHGYRRTT